MKAIADDNLAWTCLRPEILGLPRYRAMCARHPANILLDPNGVIIARNITGEDLHKTLQEVIK